jgi:hypothetical protein
VEIYALAPRIPDGGLALGSLSRGWASNYLCMAFFFPGASIATRFFGNKILELRDRVGGLGSYRFGIACTFD